MILHYGTTTTAAETEQFTSVTMVLVVLWYYHVTTCRWCGGLVLTGNIQLYIHMWSYFYVTHLSDTDDDSDFWRCCVWYLARSAPFLKISSLIRMSELLTFWWNFLRIMRNSVISKDNFSLSHRPYEKWRASGFM